MHVSLAHGTRPYTSHPCCSSGWHEAHATSALCPDTDSDSENKLPTDKHHSRKTYHSLSKADSSILADFSAIKELLAKGEEQHQESSKQMAEILWESTQVYEKTSEKFLEVLMQLVHN